MSMAPRQRILLSILWGTALVLAAALVAWFLDNFERRSEPIDAGMSAQARGNPFLAAERFLRRIGTPAEGVGGRELLRELPPPSDMLVVDSLSVLNERRRAGLHAWLESGGRLLTAPAGFDGEGASAARDLVVGYGARLDELDDVQPGETVLTRVFFDGYPRALELELPARRILVDRPGEADGRVSAGGHGRILQYDVGGGRITVISDMAPFRNDRIGDRDHALFLALLAEHAEGGKVWLLYDSGMPWLGALLWRHAPHVLIAAGCLLLALLWHLGGRLGPLLPSPERRRRDLMAHLQALSDFHWRHGRGSHLVWVTRGRVERAWLRRYPMLRGLGPEQRAAWIGRHTGLAAAQVRGVLYPVGEDDRRLVSDTRILQRLWNGLGRGKPQP
jgi:hypothetical protein